MASAVCSSTAATTESSDSSIITCIKSLTESPHLNSILSSFASSKIPDESLQAVADEKAEGASIPVVDVSLLNSTNSEERAKAIHDLGKACQQWGVFMVINHGIPEIVTKALMMVCEEFYNGITEEEKGQFEAKHTFDPIRFGTSISVTPDQHIFWRDFIKIFVHPQFHCFNKPEYFRDILLEYSEKTRNLLREIAGGISESLGLEKSYMDEALELETGFQTFVANFYPPCPNPDLALGLPPHTDSDLLALLLENQVGGLQIHHCGKWLDINPLPNSFVVNVGDHLEVFSNGKYKSVVHRAKVNSQQRRISMVISWGSNLEAIIKPPLQLTKDDEQDKVAYAPMKYKEDPKFLRSNLPKGESSLDWLKLAKK